MDAKPMTKLHDVTNFEDNCTAPSCEASKLSLEHSKPCFTAEWGDETPGLDPGGWSAPTCYTLCAVVQELRFSHCTWDSNGNQLVAEIPGW